MTLQAAAALLATAFLFGGMVLFSFSFAAFLFTHLPAAEAGSLLRKAFPWFYLWVIGMATAAAALHLGLDQQSAIWLAVVAVTTIPARQQLMPAINAATDAGESARFKRLHGLSVAIGLAQIAAVGYVLIRIL